MKIRNMIICLILLILLLSGCMSISPYADVEFVNTKNENVLLAIYGKENAYIQEIIKGVDAKGENVGSKVDTLYYDEYTNIDDIYNWIEECNEKSCIVFIGWSNTAEEIAAYAHERDIDIGHVNIHSKKEDVFEGLKFDIGISYTSFGKSAGERLAKYLGKTQGRIILLENEETDDSVWTDAFVDAFEALGEGQKIEIIDEAEYEEYLAKNNLEAGEKRILAVVSCSLGMYNKLLLCMNDDDLTKSYLVTIVDSEFEDVPDRPCILYESQYKDIGISVIEEANNFADSSSVCMVYEKPDYVVNADY